MKTKKNQLECIDCRGPPSRPRCDFSHPIFLITIPYFPFTHLSLCMGWQKQKSTTGEGSGDTICKDWIWEKRVKKCTCAHAYCIYITRCILAVRKWDDQEENALFSHLAHVLFWELSYFREPCPPWNSILFFSFSKENYFLLTSLKKIMFFYLLQRKMIIFILL